MSSINQASIKKQVDEMSSQASQGMKQAGEKLQEAYDKNVSPEVKQQAQQIKQDVKQSLNQAQSQAQQHAQKMKSDMNRGFGFWLKQQEMTAREYWSDIMKQPNFAKGLLGAIVFTNLICPIFFMNRAEGVITFLSYICVSILSHFLYQMAPKSSPNRLFTSTFSHLLWVPLIFWLTTRASKFDLVSAKADMEHVDVTVSLLLRKGFFLTNWIRLLLSVNSIALTLDAIKLAQILQRKAGSTNVRGQQQQPMAKTAGGDNNRHQLIGENEGSNEDRQRQFEREQEGIKQRMRTNVTAPTA